MNQRDDAAAMVLQDSLESDAETSAARADCPTLIGLAPIDDQASDSAADGGEAASAAAAPEPSDDEQPRSDIETSTVRPMQLLAEDAAQHVSQADEAASAAPVVASEPTPSTEEEQPAAAEPPSAPEEEDPEWLDLSTRWLITPRPRTARTSVEEDEVTEHLRWADRLVVQAMPRAEPRGSAPPPPPPLHGDAPPRRRVTMAFGRPSELPPEAAPALPPTAATLPQPVATLPFPAATLPHPAATLPHPAATLPHPAATWNAPARSTAEWPPPWAAGGNYGPPNHYPPSSRSGTPTGYTPFEVGPRRVRSRRPKPSELSLELWQSISDTWLATAFKWAIALLMLHYSGLVVPVMAFFGYAPAPHTALASAVPAPALQPAAANVAPGLAAPSSSPERTPAALDEDDVLAGKSRRLSVQREVSETSENFVHHYASRPARKPRAALPLQHKVATATPPAAAPRAAPQVLATYVAPPPPIAADAASDDAVGEAFLRINSRPWSQVFVDGTHVGHTPKIDLRVRAGAHRIRFVNAELGVSKTVDLLATPGATVSHVEFLEE